jgi:hypothetical protein
LNAESVIMVVKVVAEQYFKTSEFTDMTSNVTKTTHEVNSERNDIKCNVHYDEVNAE